MNQYRVEALPRLFEQVARQIVQYIQSESLAPGSKLPTERRLGELLQVSRSSVREGIRVLELLRYLESRQGEGTFVAEPSPFLLPHLVLKQDVSLEVMDRYFGIAAMCLEHIWLKADPARASEAKLRVSSDHFWVDLGEWTLELAASLDNPYYASLFSEVFLFLQLQGYFHAKTAPFELEQLIDAAQAGKMDQVRELLQRLSREI